MDFPILKCYIYNANNERFTQMAGIKNHEIAAILREWLDSARVSQAEAARQLHITPPVLWRQLEARDSMPLSRIEQFVNLWSPSDAETTRLESALNEFLSPNIRNTSFDCERCLGRLDVVSSVLHNAILENVPENLKPTISTIAGLLDETIEELSSKRVIKVSSEKRVILPRKSASEWRKIELEKEAKRINQMLFFIEHSHALSGDSEKKELSPEEKVKKQELEARRTEVEQELSSLSVSGNDEPSNKE